MKRILILLLTFFSYEMIYSHARLKVPTPRTNQDNLKFAECGGAMTNAAPTEYTAGSTIKVDWEETINHPGKFLIYLLEEPQGQDATRELLDSIIDNQDNPIQNGVFHQYTADIELPDRACETNCSIQLIQSMEENPNAPTFYYSCANVKITKVEVTPPPTTEDDNNSTKNDEVITKQDVQNSFTPTSLGCASSASTTQTDLSKKASLFTMIFLLLPFGLLFRRRKK
jgi:hypothetical protein